MYFLLTGLAGEHAPVSAVKGEGLGRLPPYLSPVQEGGRRPLHLSRRLL